MENEELIKELDVAFQGDKKLSLFFIAWLKNGNNATKAYLEIHPDVTYESAAVLGSRELRKVNISFILDAYGLGIKEYIKQFKEGHNAMMKKWRIGPAEPDHKVRSIYNKRLGKLLGIEKSC